MADLDNDPTNITLFGTINDVVPTQTDSTPNNLIVSDFTISDTSIRVSVIFLNYYRALTLIIYKILWQYK